MNVHSLEVAFENIFEKISGNVELLTELDQKMGDGDLGISVKTGFQGTIFGNFGEIRKLFPNKSS